MKFQQIYSSVDKIHVEIIIKDIPANAYQEALPLQGILEAGQSE